MAARSKTVTTGRARPAAAVDPGALVMVGIEGKVLDAAQAAFLRRNRIRAVVLFRGNLGSEAAVRALTAALRKAMGPGALSGGGQWGGAGVRPTFLPHAPGARAPGAAGRGVRAEEVGAGVG